MKKIIFSVFLGVLFLACDGEDSQSNAHSSNKSVDVLSINSQKDFLYNLFTTEYLWADEVSSINYDIINNPQEIIDNLKVEKDKWSFAIPLSLSENISNQKSYGFGCSIRDNIIYRLNFDSPCEKSGLKRGDKILRINDKNISDEVYKEAQNNENIESIFTIQRGNDKKHIKISSRNYKYKTVKYKIFDLNNSKIAYLIFDSFTEASVDELKEAFTYFKNNMVEELIVDLRYNGGGSLATASILLDKIAGFNNEGKIQTKIKWNDNYSKNNYSLTFSKDENSLNLNRVFFLVTKDSASASEMVINSLKPYMDEVILIGEKTHGKPVGMRGVSLGEWIYFLINFKVLNANDEGDYFDGLAVNCKIKDEYLYPRDDKKDALLKSALNFIANGTCN